MTPDQLLITFYGIAYEAERVAFSVRVIISSFRATGLYPFDPKRIMYLAQKNAGQEFGNTKAICAAELAASVGKKLAPVEEKKETTTGKLAVTPNTLFNPVEAHELKKMSDASERSWRPRKRKLKQRRSRELP